METLDLATLLPLSDGSLLFTPEAVPGTALATQLSTLANGLPITIRNATRTCADGKLEVKGIVNVLDLPNLPITLSAAAVPAPKQLQLRAAIKLPASKLLLQDLCKRLRLPAPQKDLTSYNLTFSDLALETDQTGYFWLEATMAPTPGWPLELGPARLQLANVKLTVEKSGPPPAVKSRLSGELALGEALTLAMDCDTTGSFSLGAQLPGTTLRQLVKNITQQELPAVRFFDMAFEGGSVTIKREKAELLLTATGTAEGIALLLQLRRAGGGWGIALSLGLSDKAFGKLPVLEQVNQLCRLNSMLLVYSSYGSANFQLASLVAPSTQPSSSPPPLSGGLQAGLTAYASWQLTTSDKLKLLRPLRKLLQPELDLLFHLNNTLTGGRVAARVSFAFNNTTQDNPLTFAGEVGCELEAGSATLFLSGSMQTRLPGRAGQPGNPVQFDVEAEFRPTGLLISGSMLGTAEFASLPISLSNLGVVVGLNEGGIPSLGLAGMLAVDTFQSSVAVFFDSVSPSQSMLAGSVSKLTLLDVLTAFTPQAPVPGSLAPVLGSVALTGIDSIELPDGNQELANSLDARQLDKLAAAARSKNRQITSDIGQALLVKGGTTNTSRTWFLADVSSSPPVHYDLTSQGGTLTVRVNPQLYFAPQETRLGRLLFGQGLSISTKLKIIDFEALVNIQLSLDKGLLVEGSLNQPIVLGHPQLFSLTAESDPSRGARVSVATYPTTYTPTPPELAAATAKRQAWQQAQTTWQQAKMTATLKQTQDLLRGFGRATSRASTPVPRPPVLGPQPTVPVPAEVGPHFLLDGKATLLGMRTGIYVEVNREGLAFLVDDTPQRGVYIQLGGSVKGLNKLTATGTLTVGLDETTIDLGPLGSVILDTNVQGKLDLAVQAVAFSTSAISTARFEGTAQVLGQKAGFTLLFEFAGPSPLSLQQQLVAALTNVLRAALRNGQVWLDYVFRGLITGVQEASKVLVSEYKLNRDKVLELYKQVNASDAQVGAALKNTFGVVAPEEAARVLKAANYSAGQVAGTLTNTYQVGTDQLQGLLTQAGYPLEATKEAIKTIATTIADGSKALGDKVVKGGKSVLNKIPGVHL